MINLHKEKFNQKEREETSRKELTPKEYWEKLFEKRLNKTYQAITKYTEKELKRNKLSVDENLKNGVKLLEESFRTTNSEYWHKMKNKEKIDNDPIFIPWIMNNASLQQLITLDTIKQKIKEKLRVPNKSMIRYDKVKCSKNCTHNNHYYFYAYWWDSSIKNYRKKYIGKNLPTPFEILN